MKKWLSVLVFSIFFIASCTSETNQLTGTTTLREVVECGDNICDESETCKCIDCENDPKCFEGLIAEPENKQTETADETKEAINCGNGVCEENELCNLETYETSCPKDCKLLCPTKLVVGDFREEQTFFCTGECDFYDNIFTITGDSKIQTNIRNIGETASNVLTSDFNCYFDDGEVMSRRDNDGNYGIIVRDYFNDGEQKVSSINSRISGNNLASYIFEVDLDEDRETKDIRCSITLASTPDLANTYFIDITVLR